MPTFPDLRLSVVMPAYNEQVNIRTTIPKAIAALRRHVGTFELIVIDDCSKDDTGKIADEMARELPELRVVHNEVNLRQGGSLKRGFALARYDYVTHNAMDYPFDFDDLPQLLRHLPGADVVVASRKTYPGTTAPRRFVSWTNRALIRGLFGTNIVDYNFIQIYSKRAIDLPSFSDATSFITPEKIIRAHRRGWKVVEEIVDYHRREHGVPSSANAKNIKRALSDMSRLWWELRGS
jgi:glycosyltransferase involved in cell wall biosynthesis